MFQSLINRFQTLSAGRREAISYLLLVLAIFAAYANVYQDDFLIVDDEYLVLMNKFLRDWRYLPDILTHLNYAGSGHPGTYYRPIAMVLHLVLYQMFGLSKPAFHALNVVLHVINTGLMCRLGRKLGFSAGATFSAALLWCIHTLNTQNVTYISSVSEILWATFSLWGLLILLPDLTPRRSGAEQISGAFAPRKICLSIPLFLLALLSKETAIVFPALVVACLFVSSKDRLNPAIYIKTWPFWLLSGLNAAGWLLWSTHNELQTPQDYAIEGATAALNLIERTFTSLATLPTYFSLMIWPGGLHFPRSFPAFRSLWSWQVLSGMVMVTGAVAQIILGKGKRGLPLSLGIFWFAAALSPLTGIIIPIDARISEGWMYVPMIGLFLGVSQTLAVWIDGLKFKKAPIVVAAGVTIIAILFGIKTHFQNEVYQNTASFYENIFQCGEDFADMHNNLGIYYLGRNEFDKAIEQFEKVVARPGIRPPPMMAGLYTSLALAYLRVPTDKNGMSTVQGLIGVLPYTEQTTEAVKDLNKALEFEPDNYWARQFLNAIEAYQKNRGVK